MGDEIFVGVGSNLDDPAGQVQRAIERLSEIGTVLASPLYRTAAWGVRDQPDFFNAVVRMDCELGPNTLLDALQELERRSGRVKRTYQWGPRVLDLDLLAHGQYIMASDRLTLPHPRLAQRAFVLVPWAAIAPGFHVPGLGTVQDLLAACDDRGAVTLFEQE